MLSSSDDDFPDVPLSCDQHVVAAPRSACVSDTDAVTDQERRLNLLEQEMQQLRKDIQGTLHQSTSHGSSSASSRRGNCLEKTTSHHEKSSQCTHTEQSLRASSVVTAEEDAERLGEVNDSDDAEKSSTHSRRGEHRSRSRVSDLAIDARRSEEVMYELHSLVPHLSTSFSCSARDALLFIMSIRSGGSTDGSTTKNSSGVAGGMSSGPPAPHKVTTLLDRVNLLEAEKRGLEQRLQSRVTECELLKDELASVKQRLQAVQQQSLQTQTTLSQRREETRRQLMLEETRGEKMRVRNRKLEAEVEQLKDRLRAQLR